MTQDTYSHEANGKRDAQSHLIRARKTQLASSLSKAALIVGLAAAWTMIGDVLAPSETAAQEQPPLPPVTVESPTPRPRAVTQPAARASSTRVKRAARHTNRTATRPNPTTAPVTANAAPPQPAVPKEGSEAAGYKPDTVNNFGPLGQKPIQDVPYSVNVISSDLIDNKIAAASDDVFKISPVVQLTAPNSRGGQVGYLLRGFAPNSVSEDGIRGYAIWQYPLEDKERVEITTGLTSFLYGATAVGGMVNYVYKRPTDKPIANVTIGDYGNLAGFAHGDFGGPIDKENQFGYRINIVEQHGNLPIDHQGQDRQLVTAALDWHMAPETTLGLIGTYNNWVLKPEGEYWLPSAAANGASLFHYGWVPNPSQLYGQLYSDVHFQSERGEINFRSKLNDIFTTRMAYSFTNYRSFPNINVNNTLGATSDTGIYTQSVTHGLGTVDDVHAGYAFLDAHFSTWSFMHDVTTGFYGNYATQYLHSGSTNTVTPGPFNIFNGPVYTSVPSFYSTQSYYGNLYRQSTSTLANYVLGDDIKFNQYLSALVGANYAQIGATNYNGTPPYGLSSSYDAGKLTPSLSLILKPVPWVSTYFTYSESLEQGQIVPSTGAPVYTNAGQILPPFTSKEYEIGAKATIGGMLLTGALFEINKVNQYAQVNPNGTSTYVQDGREVHKGIELTATGNIMEGLRVLGGVTIMDARVLQTASPTTEDKYPVNVANQMAKTTLEYDLPFARGITLTGGVYYVGKMPVDAINSVFIPGYVTEDLGLRYRATIPTGQEVIFRLNVSNLANTAYWLNANNVGAPRTIAMSTEVKF